jgi:hypothetical protein
MMKMPPIPMIPNDEEAVDGSGANTKAQYAKNTENNVQTDTKTMWKLRSDMVGLFVE